MTEYEYYRDSHIEYVGLIPSHWKIVQNKRVMHKEKKICNTYSGQDIISLTMNGVIIRDLGAGGKMPTSFDGYQYVYPGELLMCLFDIDVTPRCVGRVFNEGLTSPAYSSFVLHDNADLGYFYYYYLTLDHTKELLHFAKNLRHSLTEEQLGQIKVPLPPITEQIAIANYLDEKTKHIDSIISEAKASIEEYKEWKASIIYEAVTKGLDPNAEMKDSGVEWIGEIPSNWKKMRIKDCATFMPKVDFSSVENDSLVTFTPMECIKNGYFESKGKKLSEIEGSYTPYAEGDVVFAKVTPCFENGNAAIMENLFSRVGFGSSELFVLRAKNIDTKYLFYFIRNKGFIQAATATMTGTGGLKRVSSVFVKNTPIPIPSKEAQKEITDYLDKKCKYIDDLVIEKESLISDLESYKKSLIFEVVTGKQKVV